MDKHDVLVVDVESTCWEPKNTQPPDQEREIIEIGITVVNLVELEIKSSHSILVRPDYSELSEFCTRLTTLTPGMLEAKGVDFKFACQRLREDFDSQRRTWISWGNYDREQFFRDCLRKGVEYPYGSNHLNVSRLFGIMHGRDKSPGVQRALRRLGMKFEGTHHRGVDDSYNIARIFVELMKRSRTSV